jgi:hypothetical protein
VGNIAPSDTILARCVGLPADNLSYTLTAFDQLAAEFSPTQDQTERWRQYLYTYPCDLHTDAPITVQ